MELGRSEGEIGNSGVWGGLVYKRFTVLKTNIYILHFILSSQCWS